MEKSGLTLFSPFEQAIDHFVYKPVTNWQRFFNPQFTFNYNPEDQDVEQHVLNRVGSYGRQLSILIDMIELMQSRLLDEAQLNSSQKLVAREFARLLEDSRMAVADFNGDRKPQTGDKLLAELSALKQRDPKEFDAMKKALNDIINET